MGKHRPGRDLISDLPVSLIENILVFLPIGDAIRTSVLSTKWRYKWTTLPCLVFDDCDLGMKGLINDNISFTTFVTRTLSRHEGPLHKFTLDLEDMEASSETDSWLLLLSRKDIKELILQGSCDFRVPSCLFSYQNLTYLKIFGCCAYSTPPPNFKGYLCLRTLILKIFTMPVATIQFIVDHSPLLENLECIDPIRSESVLTFNAPKLKCLKLMFDSFAGENLYFFAPLLTKLSLSVVMNHHLDYKKSKAIHCYYTKFLGAFPDLESLNGDGALTKYLSLGMEHYQHPLVFHCLKTINLGDVCFDSMDEILAAVHLIVDASSTLCELQLTNVEEPIRKEEEEEYQSKIPGLHFWDSICPQNCTLGKLKCVRMESFCGGIQEMNFIKFLLANSPVLEEMTVKLPCYSFNKKPTEEQILNSTVELLSYRRASNSATILFKRNK